MIVGIAVSVPWILTIVPAGISVVLVKTIFPSVVLRVLSPLRALSLKYIVVHEGIVRYTRNSKRSGLAFAVTITTDHAASRKDDLSIVMLSFMIEATPEFGLPARSVTPPAGIVNVITQSLVAVVTISNVVPLLGAIS